MTEQERNPLRADVPPRGPWVTRIEAAAVLALASIFLIAALVIAVRQHRAGDQIEVIQAEAAGAEYRIDLNTAGVQELMLLPGIGEVRSQRIVDWREAHGPITSNDDVREATGLSASAVEKLREFIVWPGDAGAPEEARRPPTDAAETREMP